VRLCVYVFVYPLSELVCVCVSLCVSSRCIRGVNECVLGCERV